MHCRPSVGRRFGAHLEIFARGRVVAIPPGIGIAPPRVRDGAFVRGGRCSYPLRTVEPTGLIEVAPGRRYTLGDLFTVWGQPLGARRLAGFTTPAGETVRGYVAGRRWNGDVRAIPLSRHSVLALAVSGRAFPHPTYAFPAGF